MSVFISPQINNFSSLSDTVLQALLLAIYTFQHLLVLHVQLQKHLLLLYPFLPVACEIVTFRLDLI